MQDVLERERRAAQAQDGGGGILAKALSGAAAGAVGTWALDRVDWRMWNNETEETRAHTTAVRPFGEPPANVIVRKAEERFGSRLSDAEREAAGTAVHYGIGIAPAVVYAVFRDRLPGSGPGRGLLYGLTLFLLQDEAVNAASGLSAKPSEYPWQAHARGLVAHLVYGIATEMALNLVERSSGAAQTRIGMRT
jgi:hypothetical protein